MQELRAPPCVTEQSLSVCVVAVAALSPKQEPAPSLVSLTSAQLWLRKGICTDTDPRGRLGAVASLMASGFLLGLGTLRLSSGAAYCKDDAVASGTAAGGGGPGAGELILLQI